MLVLTRYPAAKDVIHPENMIVLERDGETITIVCCKIEAGVRARIGVEADQSWSIRRGELPREDNRSSARS